MRRRHALFPRAMFSVLQNRPHREIPLASFFHAPPPRRSQQNTTARSQRQHAGNAHAVFASRAVRVNNDTFCLVSCPEQRLSADAAAAQPRRPPPATMPLALAARVAVFACSNAGACHQPPPRHAAGAARSARLFRMRLLPGAQAACFARCRATFPAQPRHSARLQIRIEKKAPRAAFQKRKQ